MSQGNDLANYASSVDTATASEDVWYVAVAPDDIKQMSIDQLDEAFRAGVISEKTAVWTEGMENWAPLGEVANLDADGGDSGSVDGSENAAGMAHAGFDFSSQQSGPRVTQPGFAAGPSSFAPVTASLSPASIFSPDHAAAPSAHGMGPGVSSVEDELPVASRTRRFRPERWLLAAAALAAVGVTAYNNRDIVSGSGAVAAAEAQPKAFAARPYDEGGVAVASPSASTSAPAAAPAPAKPKAAEPADDEEPSSASGRTEPAVAKSAAKADDEDSKESLKGSFNKAFSKKASAKSAKAVKPRKTASRAASRASKASKAAAKKPGAPRAGSAFDPLNDSLP